MSDGHRLEGAVERPDHFVAVRRHKVPFDLFLEGNKLSTSHRNIAIFFTPRILVPNISL